MSSGGLVILLGLVHALRLDHDRRLSRGCRGRWRPPRRGQRRGRIHKDLQGQRGHGRGGRVLLGVLVAVAILAELVGEADRGEDEGVLEVGLGHVGLDHVGVAAVPVAAFDES